MRVLAGAIRAEEHASSDRLRARIRSPKLRYTDKSDMGAAAGEVPSMKNEGMHFCSSTDPPTEAKDFPPLSHSLSSTASVVQLTS